MAHERSAARPRRGGYGHLAQVGVSGRAVFINQLLVAAAVLLLILASAVFNPRSFASGLFFAGVTLVFVATGLSATVPWRSLPRALVATVPAVDILAIVAVRAGAPALGSGLFLVFPVIWLARDFGVGGAVGAVGTSTLLLWASELLVGFPFDASDFPALVLLPVTLAFVATSVHLTTRRTIAQSVLLRQQTVLIESALARARRQEDTLHNVLNAVDFGVIAFDRAGSVTLVNAAHRRTLDRFGAGASGVVPAIVYQPDRVTPYTDEERPFSRAMRGQSFDNLTIWVGPPGGDRAAFSVSARRLVTTSGEYDGGVIILRDTTAELDAIQARDDLVATVSHELRTPLTSILGYLDLAQDEEDLGPSARAHVQVAGRNAERLLQLVNDLLLAASDAEGQPKISPRVCDVREIVDQAVEGQRAFAQQHQVELRWPAGGPPLRVEADPLRVRQIVDNLLSNAIKYNREGGSVTVRASATDNAVEVAVTDTGQGITPRELARLFDRYYRTESARRSSVHGTGIGLSISRTLARLHGGDLNVASAPGQGTTFTLRLPTNLELAPRDRV